MGRVFTVRECHKPLDDLCFFPFVRFFALTCASFYDNRKHCQGTGHSDQYD